MELWLALLVVSLIILVIVQINSHLNNLQLETKLRKQEDILLEKNLKIKELQLAFEFLAVSSPKENSLDKKTLLLINVALNSNNNNEATNAAFAACARINNIRNSSAKS